MTKRKQLYPNPMTVKFLDRFTPKDLKINIPGTLYARLRREMMEAPIPYELHEFLFTRIYYDKT